MKLPTNGLMDCSLRSFGQYYWEWYDAWPLSFWTLSLFFHSQQWLVQARQQVHRLLVCSAAVPLARNDSAPDPERNPWSFAQKRKNLSPVSTCSSCKRLLFNPPPPTPPLLCTLEIVLNLLPALPIPLNDGLCNKGGFVDEPPEPTRVKPAW